MAHDECDSAVLITGFPRLTARLMAEQLLAQEDKTRLFCVVSAKQAELAQSLVNGLETQQRQRVVLLEGDPSAIDMGLSGIEFRQLTSQLERIYHMAHLADVRAPRDLVEYVNVEGTREAIGMARACPALRCLVLRSTAAVSGSRTGLVYEDETQEGKKHRTIVEETHAHAERIARRMMTKTPIAIVRPSTVVGHSQTGEIDRFDGPYTILLLLLNAPPDFALPLPAVGDELLNVVPIDFVVRASHYIGLDPRAAGHVFHLVDPNPLSARRVVELIARASGHRSPRGQIPSYVARALMRAPGLEKFLRSPRAFLELLTTDVRYDARNADAILAGTGIVCPSFESYVDRLVAYVREFVRAQRRREDAERSQAEDPLS